MKKKYTITNEEFDAIKEAIESALDLWNYDYIAAFNEDGYETSMSKKVFFETLKDKFILPSNKQP